MCCRGAVVACVGFRGPRAAWRWAAPVERACEPLRVEVRRHSRYRITPLLKGLFIPQEEDQNPEVPSP